MLCLARIRFVGGGNDEAGSRSARWDALKRAPYIWGAEREPGWLGALVLEWVPRRRFHSRCAVTSKWRCGSGGMHTVAHW